MTESGSLLARVTPETAVELAGTQLVEVSSGINIQAITSAVGTTKEERRQANREAGLRKPTDPPSYQEQLAYSRLVERVCDRHASTGYDSPPRIVRPLP